MALKNLKFTALFLIFLTAIFKLGVLIFDIKDRGFEPDSYQHFLELRTVFADFPNHLDIAINVWSKPLHTIIFGLPVEIFNLDKLIWVQFFNLIIFSVIAYLIFKISKEIFKNESVALISLIATLLSFLLFKSSVTALTEPIFTLMLVLGFFYVVKEKYSLASLFFGLSVLGRIEGLFFVGIFNLWLLWKLSDGKGITESILKNIATCWIISVIPVLIWNTVGYLDTGRILYIFDNGYPTAAGLYGFGSWLDYPKRLLIEAPIISISFAISSLIFIKSFKKFNYWKELVLAFVFFTGFALTQIYFWKIGQFGSAGLMRYLISVLPFAIIFSGIFFKWLIERMSKYSDWVILSTLVLFTAITIMNIVGIEPVSSKWINLDPELVEAGEFLRDYDFGNLPLYSDKPEVIYYSGRNLENSTIFYKQAYENNVPGIYVWTASWGENLNGISYDDVLHSDYTKVIKDIDQQVVIYEMLDQPERMVDDVWRLIDLL